MAKKKLITLARELDFETENEYFDYLISSYFCGGFSQCRRLFDNMKKEDQKDFITYSNTIDTKVSMWFFTIL